MNRNTELTLFPVFARTDSQRVQTVVSALKAVGIKVWIETEQLQPGSNWQDQIRAAIDDAAGALVFISPALTESQYALREMTILYQYSKPILGVVIEEVPTLPPEIEYLLGLQPWIHLAGHSGGVPLEEAERIRQWVAHAVQARRPVEDGKAAEGVKEVAATLADAVRKVALAPGETTSPPTSVFIVHGHDDELLREVEGHLTALGVESVVLRRIGGPAQSLFQKFMRWGRETRFALVLLSADDLGVSRAQYEADGVGIHALQFRARQNVILELGFFYGHLGWENVFVLFKAPDRVFPNFERPSDLGGVVFDMVEESGQWKSYLEQKLTAAGFDIE